MSEKDDELFELPDVIAATATECKKCGWNGVAKDLVVLEGTPKRPTLLGCPNCHNPIIGVL